MSLPSQSSRTQSSSASRALGARRFRALRNPMALGVIGAVGVASVWWTWREGGANTALASPNPELQFITTSPPRTALEETLDQGPVTLQAAPPSAPTTAPPAPAATSLDAQLKLGHDLAATNPIEARRILSSALLSGQLASADARTAADTLNAITEQVFFTPVYNGNDTLFTQYTVQSGDALSKIVRKQKVACDWRLVKRVNNLKSESAIREGQRLKLPRGTFHARISKRDYRLDLILDNGTERTVVACFPVGLGSANGTPLGNFRVRPNSKLVNPEWTHPVSGEHFTAEDPKNPIGEHWLGLEGVDATNRDFLGYGIHGTVDPSSIGQDKSLGCVRMLDTDVAIVWECLSEPNSIIEIK